MRYPSEGVIIGWFLLSMVVLSALFFVQSHPPVASKPVVNYFTDHCSTPSGLFFKCAPGGHDQEI